MVSLLLITMTLGWVLMQYEQLRNDAFFNPHYPMTKFLMSTSAEALKGLLAWLVAGVVLYFAIQTDVLALIKQVSNSQ